MTSRRMLPRLPDRKRALLVIALVGIVVAVAVVTGSLVNEVISHHADVTIFALPPNALNPYPVGIASGPDGTLWVTEAQGNAIGEITPSGPIRIFPLRDPGNLPVGNEPGDIVYGPDGNLWFTEVGTTQIARMTPAGVVKAFPIPTVERPAPYFGQALGSPQGLTVGPDGALWFGLDFDFSQAIGRMTLSGTFSVFFLSNYVTVQQIVAGPDGNLWFTVSGSQLGSDTIGRITPAGKITEFKLPNSSGGPIGITRGPDGNLWFCENAGNRIGRITRDGSITEFALLTSVLNSVDGPDQIAPGPDGNLWFTESLSDKIGRITPGGYITQYMLPRATQPPQGYPDEGYPSGLRSIPQIYPQGIVAGPDGRLWFTETFQNAIGRLAP